MIKNLQALWNNLLPIQAYSWQSFFWTSLFSLVMAGLLTPIPRFILFCLAALFFIISMTWLCLKNNVPLTPWITSALICLALFLLVNIPSQALILLWLPLAGTIAAYPCFFDKFCHFHAPTIIERQKLVILLGTQILLSCLLQVNFLMQNWLDQYPSLLVDDFSRSVFVVKWQVTPRIDPQGLLLLDTMGELLQRTLGGKNWTETGEWLRGAVHPRENEEQSDSLGALRQEAIAKLENRLNPLAEYPFWAITIQVSEQPNLYLVTLLADWTGPRSERSREQNPYLCEMICQVEPSIQGVSTNCQRARRNSLPPG
ncbi:DUF5357 domain-containing protein [Spirulina subsalsa FACHB-351]|uniref:DUF5357 domain-containing protein n=1 Tax=Spirulina subsalsa FACHB-351 TaxID=234711 RepID=A0ABT3L8D8_9CYAN|nr:DUF5357 domain-containing protein [Spirulina subsalsa]MCW6037776.1 DUF5357 domain-containing protein [Spirulina subsalsa FACHB-351]